MSGFDGRVFVIWNDYRGGIATMTRREERPLGGVERAELRLLRDLLKDAVLNGGHGRLLLRTQADPPVTHLGIRTVAVDPRDPVEDTFYAVEVHDGCVGRCWQCRETRTDHVLPETSDG